MRVLLAKAPSVEWFAAGVVLDVAVRSCFLAAMTGGVERVGLALRFTVAALVPAWMAAELAYSGQAILYAALSWAGAAISLFALLLLGPVPWRSGRGRVRGLAGVGGRVAGQAAGMLVLAPYFAATAVLGSLVRGRAEAVDLLGVVASASLSAIVAGRLARSPRHTARSRAALGSVALAVLVLTGLPYGAAGPAASGAGRSARQVVGPGHAKGTLFVVAGIDTSSGHGSAFLVRPRLLGFTCAQTAYFSYAGPGGGAPRGQAACPIDSGARYTREETGRPLPTLVRAFRAEVGALAPPVTVIAHSSGAWIAWRALSGERDTTVKRLILLAPLWGGVGYPLPGAYDSGAVGASGMRLVSAVGRAIHFSTFDPSEPLALEMLAAPGASEALFARPLPSGVRAVAIQSAFDLAVTGTAPRNSSMEVACPVGVPHGEVPESLAAMAEARAFLAGKRPAPCPWWSSWPGALTATFRVP